MELIKLKKEDLSYLYGYYSGHPKEVLKNAEVGIYQDPKDYSITIVTCGGNDGDYTQVKLSRGQLQELGYLRNSYGETDYLAGIANETIKNYKP
jgi:hypothetical protein